MEPSITAMLNRCSVCMIGGSPGAKRFDERGVDVK
jgi:hypothetical protein